MPKVAIHLVTHISSSNDFRHFAAAKVGRNFSFKIVLRKRIKYLFMKSKLPVSRIMTQRMASVRPEDNLEHVRQIFEGHGFHHIPVVEGSKLTGIVSYTDYLRIIHDYFSNLESKPASEKLLQTLTVKDMMTENPVCMKPNDTVETALRVFRENQFHALPVTDEHGKLLGILTTYDVMKVFEDNIAPEHSYSE